MYIDRDKRVSTRPYVRYCRLTIYYGMMYTIYRGMVYVLALHYIVQRGNCQRVCSVWVYLSDIQVLLNGMLNLRLEQSYDQRDVCPLQVR